MNLQEAAHNWAQKYETMYDADSFHASLLFSEAEALANLLAATNRPELATNLMEQWAENDSEDADAHAAELKALQDTYNTQHEANDTSQHQLNIDELRELARFGATVQGIMAGTEWNADTFEAIATAAKYHDITLQEPPQNES